MQFFLIALIFLIFDIELVLLFPVLLNAQAGAPGLIVFQYFIFLLVLSLGLFAEWAQGMLEWKT